MKIRKAYPQESRHLTQANGDRVWMMNNGKLHRLNGPAVIKPDGTREWWVNGNLHREDGAAVIKPDGTKEWWVDGLPHREDGPAIESSNGLKEWFFEGKRHCLDGPAVEQHEDGSVQWWINGQKFDPEIYFEIIKHPELINAMTIYLVHET